MGILNRLRSTPGERVDAALGGAVVSGPGPFAPQVAAPWAPANHLQTFLYPDLFGTDNLPLTRQAAIGIPAIARARLLVAGAIARCPLEVFTNDTLVDPQPPWTYRTDEGLPPFHRMLWTVDDLLFHGWSLWVARRGYNGELLSAARVDIGRWRFADRRILVDGSEVDQRDVLLIPGPHEGILTMGGKAIRQAAGLEDQAASRAANPSANIELHHTGDVPLTREQIVELVSDWSAARRGENGGVAYTSKTIEVKEHGAAAEQLLIEGRNAAAVNLARLVGLPASMIDATADKAALTYETSVGRNGEFIDYGLAPYMAAIASRLSMDDVVPRGQSTRFNTRELRDIAPSPTGPATQD